MPRVIQAATDEVIELEELVEALETGGFDARDEDNFASWGPMLKKLGNNRRFLTDTVIAELKQRGAGQIRSNQYTAQVIMLHNGSSGFLIRANFWPAMKDSLVRQGGTDPFFYNIPHDHNFSFLTVGYLGPGYWSDYYEYDYETVVGTPGEKVDLRFVEKARLEEGKVMLYRAHRDVHLQLPADELSVSLNILETSYGITFRDQYRFNIEDRTIAGIMTRTAIDPLLALAVRYGGDNGMDLVTDFAASHPSERIRWCATRALAATAPTVDARLAVYEDAARDEAPLVAALARRDAAALAASRAWIEAERPTAA